MPEPARRHPRPSAGHPPPLTIAERFADCQTNSRNLAWVLPTGWARPTAGGRSPSSVPAAAEQSMTAEESRGAGILGSLYVAGRRDSSRIGIRIDEIWVGRIRL